MKIGLMTPHFTINYGSNLQAYALMTVLQRLGGECEIIRQAYSLKRAPLYKRIKDWKSFKYWLYTSIQLNNFKRFREQFFNYYPSEKLLIGDDLPNLVHRYDRIVVGSDQVWSPDIMKMHKADDYRMFLDFVKDEKKKCSYAASIGVESLPAEMIPIYKKYLSSFTHLSVRELKAQQILKEIGIKSELVLDPTLLLDYREWSNMAVCPKTNKDYIFLFTVGHPSEHINKMEGIANRMAKTYNLNLVKKHTNDYNFTDTSAMRNLTPQKWLGYILNSKYVVTNSYHGLAFCINLSKQFYLMPVDSTKSRYDTLLGYFDLKDRIINENTDFCNMPNINYTPIQDRLVELRNRSLSYVESILK